MTTSSKSLKSWISKLDILRNKKNRLKEELAYSHAQFIGVKGVSYGNEIRGSGNNYDDKMLYWIDKMEQIKNKIRSIDDELIRYQNFKKQFTGKALKVIELYYEQNNSSADVARKLEISSRRLFQYCKKIENTIL